MKASVVCLLFASLLVIVLPRGNDGHKLKKNLNREELQRKYFKNHDEDNNGYISLNELRIKEADYELEGYAEYLMERLDTNKDNQLSLEEFQDMSSEEDDK